MIKAMGRFAAAGALSLLAAGCSTTSPSHYARNSPFDQRLDRRGFTPYSASRDGGAVGGGGTFAGVNPAITIVTSAGGALRMVGASTLTAGAVRSTGREGGGT